MATSTQRDFQPPDKAKQYARCADDLGTGTIQCLLSARVFEGSVLTGSLLIYGDCSTYSNGRNWDSQYREYCTSRGLSTTDYLRKAADTAAYGAGHNPDFGGRRVRGTTGHIRFPTLCQDPLQLRVLTAVLMCVQ